MKAAILWNVDAGRVLALSFLYLRKGAVFVAFTGAFLYCQSKDTSVSALQSALITGRGADPSGRACFEPSRNAVGRH
ncbi:MAG: hypothetical protein C7B45_10010 [Sulfobacillus acidophilus]|uniref:Uncharacterized protein n=1 Tax=Sulfobacillus acidophilus TaxID=53633 RepID=A0A2T2WHB8_9FIRM|nr:MAG: hypothetical protein C7B45_10010 [Sulfobacillus acidophilus]